MKHRIRRTDLKRINHIVGDEDLESFILNAYGSGMTDFFVRISEKDGQEFCWKSEDMEGEKVMELSPVDAQNSTREAPIFLALDQQHMAKLIREERLNVPSFIGIGLFTERTSSSDRVRYRTLESSAGSLLHRPRNLELEAFILGSPRKEVYLLHLCFRVNDVYVLTNCPIAEDDNHGLDDVEWDYELRAHEEQDSSSLAKVRDRYNLRDSSPHVFTIMQLAYANWGVRELDSAIAQSTIELRKINARFPGKRPPFSSKRLKMAAELTAVDFVYTGGSSRSTALPKVKRPLPRDRFLEQPCFNSLLRKLLYAACWWSNKLDDKSEKREKALIDFLVDLGLFDAYSDDQAQVFAFFITGRLLNRQEIPFRHTTTR